MYENKLNLTDIDLLIEESKKINFSSEPEIRNLVRKYPMNFKGVGILNENSLIEYLKTDENYKDAYSIISYFASKPFAKSIASNVGAEEEKGAIKRILNKIKEFFYT